MKDESCTGSDDRCLRVRGSELDAAVEDLAERIGFEFQAGDSQIDSPATAQPELGVGPNQFVKFRMDGAADQDASSVACEAHSQDLPHMESSMKDWGTAIQTIAFWRIEDDLDGTFFGTDRRRRLQALKAFDGMFVGGSRFHGDVFWTYDGIESSYCIERDDRSDDPEYRSIGHDAPSAGVEAH